ncbi:MAG: hypothetical protein HYS26_03455 [Candidatus Kaiserbacteria bacterium]|nr:MAG: hypothetical protein HYS26_03455 [Candidatus Kaiserbacteria bacterium]
MDKPEEKKGVGKFAHTKGHPPRVASRLEGVVKNRGIKPRKKKGRR